MDSSMFLPKEIKIGYQNRMDTYTGKLGYVVYFDERGKLRKERSFESWRDADISTDQYENEPTSGFVLNKKAGGYSSGWNHRQTYVRIYDPRGFEFEITVENLLYILDNTSSIVGKGLEGEFVYAWSDGDLVLLPVSAPEYENLKQLNDLRHKKEYIKVKDLKVGATYLTKQNEELVYLGRFYEYTYDYHNLNAIRSSKTKFFFSGTEKKNCYDKNISIQAYELKIFPSMSQKLIDVVDESVHESFSELFDSLASRRVYSPVDLSKTKTELISKEEFIRLCETESTVHVYDEAGNEFYVITYDENPYIRETDFYIYDQKKYKHLKTFEDFFEFLKPRRKYFYLENGRFYEKRGTSK